MTRKKLSGSRGIRQVSFYLQSMDIKDRLKDLAYRKRTTVQALCERAVLTMLMAEEGNKAERPEWWPETEEEKAVCKEAIDILRAPQRSENETIRSMLRAVLRFWQITMGKRKG